MVNLVNVEKVNSNEVYKPAALASLLGIRSTTVYKWIREGRICKLTRERLKLPITTDVDGREYIEGTQYIWWLKEVFER